MDLVFSTDIELFKHFAIFLIRKMGKGISVFPRRKEQTRKCWSRKSSLIKVQKLWWQNSVFLSSQKLIKNEARSEKFLVYSKLNSVLPEKRNGSRRIYFSRKNSWNGFDSDGIGFDRMDYDLDFKIWFWISKIKIVRAKKEEFPRTPPSFAY